MSEYNVPCDKCSAVGDYCQLECPDGSTIDCRDLVSAEWQQRAERAETLLRELAVAALAVPVDLGRRLDEYMEAGNE